ncbi:MAG: orotate phosphoribosyltransferase [Bdellovibrionota bacterium]|nr:MAG: orotate phosphoribosyltransferase [Bdellovibrionota bacterium]
MQSYQQEFLQFLLQCKALTFGDFVTKSGRKTPYFINTGKFQDGASIAGLGTFYAQHVDALGLNPDLLFGPAYKGIPLCVSTASALATHFNRNVGFCFNRKEAKDHGDGGLFVGMKPEAGKRVVIVEDVITAGTTLQEVVPFLRATAAVDIVGVVIAVDRCERGKGSRSAVAEAQSELGVQVYPLLTIHEIIAALEGNKTAIPAPPDIVSRIRQYLGEYGASA